MKVALTKLKRDLRNQELKQNVIELAKISGLFASELWITMAWSRLGTPVESISVTRELLKMAIEAGLFPVKPEALTRLLHHDDYKKDIIEKIESKSTRFWKGESPLSLYSKKINEELTPNVTWLIPKGEFKEPKCKNLGYDGWFIECLSGMESASREGCEYHYWRDMALTSIEDGRHLRTKTSLEVSGRTSEFTPGCDCRTCYISGTFYEKSILCPSITIKSKGIEKSGTVEVLAKFLTSVAGRGPICSGFVVSVSGKHKEIRKILIESGLTVHEYEQLLSSRHDVISSVSQIGDINTYIKDTRRMYCESFMSAFVQICELTDLPKVLVSIILCDYGEMFGHYESILGENDYEYLNIKEVDSSIREDGKWKSFTKKNRIYRVVDHKILDFISDKPEIKKALNEVNKKEIQRKKQLKEVSKILRRVEKKYKQSHKSPEVYEDMPPLEVDDDTKSLSSSSSCSRNCPESCSCHRKRKREYENLLGEVLTTYKTNNPGPLKRIKT